MEKKRIKKTISSFLLVVFMVFSTMITIPAAGVQAANGDLFFSGLETGETQPTWSNSILSSSNISGYTAGLNPECSKRTGEQAHTGTSALLYSGKDNSTSSSYIYFKVYDVNIPIDLFTKLSYWIYPQSENARHAGVDFICTDGTTLRDSGARDYNATLMHPGNARGVINQWTQIQCDIGTQGGFLGKTIDKILVGYDQNPNTGTFRGYIDDILITDNSIGRPQANLLTPNAGSVYAAGQRIEASAVGQNCDSVSIELYNGYETVSQFSSSGTTCMGSFDPQIPGSYEITACAYKNGVRYPYENRSVTVQATPWANLLAPAGGTVYTLGDSINVSAAGFNCDSVSVEFYNGYETVSQISSSGTSCMGSYAPDAAGVYEITACAYKNGVRYPCQNYCVRVVPIPEGDVLKFTATSGSTPASKYFYQTISNQQYKIGNDAYNYFLEYDVYIAGDYSGVGGIELYNTDGTWYRDNYYWKDQNNVSGHPGTDISDYATGKWYHRIFRIPADFAGKTIASVNLAVENNSNNSTFVAYYDNIRIVAGVGFVMANFYQNGTPSINIPKGGQGYTCSANVVPAF